MCLWNYSWLFYIFDPNQSGWLLFNRQYWFSTDPLAARSKAWVCDGSLAHIAGSNPAGISLTVPFECCACYQVKFSVTGWSLVQWSPTDCGMSECDRKASTIRRPWRTRYCCVMKNCKLARLLVACLTVFLVIQHLPVGTADQFVCYLMVTYQYIIQHMQSVVHHLWYISSSTCFGTELPSSETHYNTGI
jgi:hypothetical protein